MCVCICEHTAEDTHTHTHTQAVAVTGGGVPDLWPATLRGSEGQLGAVRGVLPLPSLTADARPDALSLSEGCHCPSHNPDQPFLMALNTHTTLNKQTHTHTHTK